MKKWVIRQPSAEKVNKLTAGSDLTGLCAGILVGREYDTAERAGAFLSGEELSDPFMLKDMTEACEIITDAIESEKVICVYGDYDCDGITSTVILYSYLECMGADVRYYIPEREEGYGMSAAAIKKLSNEGVELIITVDNGISAVKEAELISDLGMELVITDHHQPSAVLPKAAAIVNPHRKDCISPFKKLCGAGVVLKLIAALDGGTYDMAMEQFSDLAAIGTIADVVTLTGENRTIVQNGLHTLGNTENFGLSALMELCRITPENLTSTSVAFLLAPRINASGRFGSPTTAVKLLLSEDEDEAMELAEELCRLNNERKETEQQIFNKIQQEIVSNPQVLNERVLIFSGENWHHGVIGIVSSRITEKYGKPSFIITIEGDKARGSARSIEGFSIFEALNSTADLLERFGGHTGAGGFTVSTEKIAEFSERIQSYARDTFPSMPVGTLIAEKVLEPADLTVPAIESLSVLEPFGEGNSKPLFAVIGARVDEIYSLSEGKHTKLKLSYCGAALTALLFNVNANSLAVKKGEPGDFMVYAEINVFNGNKSVSLKVADYRKHGIPQAKYFAAREAYEKYMLGEGVPALLIPRIIPVREELAAVYKAIPAEKISIDSLFGLLQSDSMNYCKLRLCIDIFTEMKLTAFFADEGSVQRLPVSQKVNLDDSKILQELRCLS